MFTLMLLACAPDLKPQDTAGSTTRDLVLSTTDSAGDSAGDSAADTSTALDTGASDDTSAPDDTGPLPDTDTDTDTDTLCACPEGYEATPAGEVCQRRLTRSPMDSGAPPLAVCAIEPYFAYGKFGARYPDGENITDDYWGHSDGGNTGRLNAAGVWACEAAGSTATGSAPVDEWIGFSICLDLDDPADFLLGMGADNRVRARVDGASIFEEDSGETRAFDYWWMQRVSLTSGDHILEFEAKNDSDLAGLGAELAGPFEAGSLVDDATMIAADYEGSLLWSTSDAIGATFDLGSAAGLRCRDGFALSLCGAAPECVKLETTACLQ